MAEHLDAHLPALRTADVFLGHLTVNLRHLTQIEFTGKHHDIGKLRIEFQRLGIADVELRGEVHLLAHRAAVGHHCHVAGDDRRDACLMGGIDDGTHGGDVVIIDDGVEREIGLDAVLLALRGNLLEVGDGEGVGGMGTHIELADAEIDGVGTRLNGGHQRLT